MCVWFVCLIIFAVCMLSLYIVFPLPCHSSPSFMSALTNHIDLSGLEHARNLKALERIDLCACKCDIIVLFILRYHRAGSTNTISTCSSLSQSHHFSTRCLM